MTMLNKIDLLFIRACKSKDPIKRVYSVYSRFYYKNTEAEQHIIHILAKIYNKYLSADLLTLIEEFNPNNPIYIEDLYYQKVFLPTIQ